MKQCPQCGSTYQDDSLSFCLSDGVALVSGYDSEATVQLPRQAIPTAQNNPARVQVPVNQPTFQSSAQSVVTNTVEKKGSNLPMIIGAIAVLGLLLIGGVALAYIALGNRGSSIAQNPTPQPAINTNVPVNQPDKTAELQEEVNKLKKMIEEQANANKKVVANKPVTNTATSKPTPAPETSEIKIATVNSPGDGFLAMRSLPSSKTGAQIMKMPHGAQVAVGACQGPMVRSGRWCRVAYNGQTGWAFDAYLIY